MTEWRDQEPKAEIRPMTSDFSRSFGAAYVDCNISLRRYTVAGDRIEVWRGSAVQLAEALQQATRLCSYVTTAQVSNTESWMEGLAERVNELLASLNDPDRIRFLVTEFHADRPARLAVEGER